MVQVSKRETRPVLEQVLMEEMWMLSILVLGFGVALAEEGGEEDAIDGEVFGDELEAIDMDDIEDGSLFPTGILNIELMEAITLVGIAVAPPMYAEFWP